MNKLGLGLIIGFILAFFIICVPPFQKPDEVVHLWNMASINFRSDFLEGKAVIPERLIKLPNILTTNKIAHEVNIKYPWRLSLYKDESKKDSEYRSTVNLNNLLPYLPGSFAIWLGDYFAYPVITVFLVRLINTLFFLFCIYILLKKIIKKRELYLLLTYLLVPMLWYQVSAVSYDAVFLGFGLIYIFLFINQILKKEIYWKEFLVFLLMSFIFQLSKGGYYILGLLPILVLWKNFKSVNRIQSFFLILGSLLSLFLIFQIYKTSYVVVQSFTQHEYDVRGQIKLLKENPSYSLEIIRENIFNEMPDYWLKSFLGVFGWLDYGFNFIGYLTNFLLLVFFSWRYLKIGSKDSVNWFIIFALGVIILLGTGSLVLLFYFVSSPLGSKIITGFQGRYFLVYFPLFIFWLKLIYDKIGANKFKNLFIGLAISIVLYQIISSTYYRYYDYSLSFSNDSLIEEKIKSIKNKSEEELGGQKINLVIGDNKFSGLQFFIEKDKYNKDKNRAVYQYKIYDGECGSGTKILISGYESAGNLSSKNTLLFHKIINPKASNICLRIDKFTQGEEYEKVYIVKDDGEYLMYPLLISR